MNSAPMYAYRPTAEQADRIRQAVAAASLVNPERAQQLQAFEIVCQQTGDGIPEQAMDSVINVILGRKRPRHVDTQLEKLFGSQPEGTFEAIGQLAAISALLEYLALDLLSTLTDDTPREASEAQLDLQQQPNEVLDRCGERAVILSPELKKDVDRTVGNLRLVREWRNSYLHTTWASYAGGWRWPRDGSPGPVVAEGEDLPDLADEAAQLAVALLDLIQECQMEKNRRLTP